MIKGSKPKLPTYVRLGISAVATIALTIVYALQPPLTFLYIVLAACIAISFSFIPNITPRQIFFCSSIAVTQIVLLHYITMSFFSFIFERPFKELFNSMDLFSYSVIITVCVLWLMLVYFKRLSFSSDIIRLSTAATYSEIISSASLVILSSTIFDTAYFYSDKYIDGQFAINVTSSVASSIMFGYLLLYSIKFVNMNLYRRKTDELRDLYHHTMAKRAIMESQVLLDGLTNLYNRKFMYESVARLCSTQPNGFVIMYIDVNGLKYVNDTFGHQSGDRYLQAVAYALSSSLRGEDYAGRIGGDEFLALLENIQEKDICIVEKRIHDAIAVQSALEQEFDMSASIGSLYVDAQLAKQGPAYVLEEADIVMRQKKAAFYKQKEIVS